MMNSSPLSDRPPIFIRCTPPWEIVTVTTCGFRVGNGEKPTALSSTCSPCTSLLRRLLNANVNPKPANVRPGSTSIVSVTSLLSFWIYAVALCEPKSTENSRCRLPCLSSFHDHCSWIEVLSLSKAQLLLKELTV